MIRQSQWLLPTPAESGREEDRSMRVEITYCVR